MGSPSDPARSGTVTRPAAITAVVGVFEIVGILHLPWYSNVRLQAASQVLHKGLYRQ
jgi:hypothetical protein